MIGSIMIGNKHVQLAFSPQLATNQQSTLSQLVHFNGLNQLTNSAIQIHLNSSCYQLCQTRPKFKYKASEGDITRFSERVMEGENNNNGVKKDWKFSKLSKSSGEEKGLSVRAVLNKLRANINPLDDRPLIPLGHGDPSPFTCFRTPLVAEDAVANTLRSAQFNGYAPISCLPPARKAVAEHISKDLPYKLSPDDVFLTVGCKQAILSVLFGLARHNANVLFPRPTFPMYDIVAATLGLEVRHYDLLPEKGWEVDLDSVQSLADDNTGAIVIINPGNPCGSVYSMQHLEKVAETARKLGLLVIADEVYEHITFGNKPFVRMGVFGSIVPVVTLGSISKRWMVPGWRFGWLVVTDPNSILQETELLERIKTFVEAACDPPTFIQGAIPEIIEKTKGEFFQNVINILSQDAELIFRKLGEIPCITCPNKPQGSMFAMVKLNLSMLCGIDDDVDFCLKLAKEEKVLLLPGSSLWMKNWLRITFALEPTVLEEGLERIKAFCQRNAKEQ